MVRGLGERRGSYWVEKKVEMWEEKTDLTNTTKTK